VGPFCAKVRRRLSKLKLLDTLHPTLRDLVTQFESCKWLVEETGRVRQKDTILDRMTEHCGTHSPNKQRLLARKNIIGNYMALAAAIRAQPAEDDVSLITAILDSRPL
jgi:hypothetical protein